MPTHKKYNTPKVKHSRGVELLTTIWLVPIIAMSIALWLAYQYYSKIGPTIEITFKENAGLIENQSHLKLRNVNIGVVTKISLSKDGDGVTVQVKVNREVSDYLNEKAKFWIVHADVGSHGVSGLDTILSGAYIELYGVKEKKRKLKFVGLDKPYIDKDAAGRYYILSAPNSNNIVEGSHVYYRMIEVGRVERVALSHDGKKVNFTIFVKEKFVPFINNESQFYTNSSLSIDISKGKLDMSVASLSQIVHGGISIYTPIQSVAKEHNQTKQRQIFPLYKNLAEMKAKHLNIGFETKVYAFKFTESNNRLEIGSPVEFNGFQVGYVTDIKNHFSKTSHRVESEVYALIHTKAFSDSNEKKGVQVIEKLVKEGLKASLDSTLPIVGSDYINLIFDNHKRASIVRRGEYDYFPTIPKVTNSTLIEDTQRLVQKLEKLPLENLLLSANRLIKDNNAPLKNLLKDLRKTTHSLDTLLKNFNKSASNINRLTSKESFQTIPAQLNQTMQELTTTLQRIQMLSDDYGTDSKFASELSLTLRELAIAAESIGRISLKLEKKPNALILGDD